MFVDELESSVFQVVPQEVVAEEDLVAEEVVEVAGEEVEEVSFA